MRIISFGELSWYLIYPLLYPIFSFLRLYMFVLLGMRKSFIIAHPFILISFYTFGLISIGIIELIFNHRTKKTNDNEQAKKSNISQLAFEALKKNNFKQEIINMLLLVLLSFMFIFNKVVQQFVCPSMIFNHVFYLLMITKMIFSGILSKFFLGYPLFRHQFFSFIISIIGIIILLHDTFSAGFYFVKYALMMLAVHFISSIEDVIVKWLLDSRFMSPFKILFFEGFFGSIILIVVYIALWYIPCFDQLYFCNIRQKFRPPLPLTYMDDFITYFPQLWNETIGTVLAIGCIAFSTMQFIAAICTNKHYSPTEMTISESLCALGWWILLSGFIGFLAKDIPENQQWLIPTFSYKYFLGYAFILIAALLYNEFFIIHLCNLGQNTKPEIINRSKKEEISLLNELNIDLVLIKNDEENKEQKESRPSIQNM